MLQITVAGGVITAVTPAPGVTRAEAWRTLGGLGTMAVQNANAVNMTGGTASLETGDYQRLGVGRVYDTACRIYVEYPSQQFHGILLRPTQADAGGTSAILFQNYSAAAIVGSIITTATATAYNTSSDVRLKEAIGDLTGALETIMALRPVHFRWRADGTPGHGFLAHEVQQVVPEAVSGTPDAVDAAGQILPMGIDPSKLVVWLVGAMQTLTQQVQALAARLDAAGA